MLITRLTKVRDESAQYLVGCIKLQKVELKMQKLLFFSNGYDQKQTVTLPAFWKDSRLSLEEPRTDGLFFRGP